MKDQVVPTVFPDCRVSVSNPHREFDLIPYFNFDDFSTPKFKEKFSSLGHAGVLFINEKVALLNIMNMVAMMHLTTSVFYKKLETSQMLKLKMGS